jgi:DNA-binding MarR family transcriptional regulator
MKADGKKTNSRPGEAFTALVLETFRFNGQLLAAGDQLTKELGLSSALWQVLGAIKEEPLPMAQIARNMGLTRQSVRRTVNVLLKRECVEFQENPDHQRAKLVALTSQGRILLDRAMQINADWADRMAKGFSVQELAAALQVIKRLGDRL